MGDATADSMMPTVAQRRELERLAAEIAGLDKVTLFLQSEDVSLGDVRGVFDTMIEQYPSTSRYLSASVVIVHNENGFVKILSQCELL